MNVYLIRHAHAGHRGGGGRDLYRPLSPKGQDQALAVAGALASAEIGAVVSSTATRCVQTVEPLASKLGLEVEEVEAFWEDSYVADALASLEKFALRGVAVSSHGNIIPEVVGALADDGMKVKGRGCAKGSVWALTYTKKGGFVEARYFDTDALSDLATLTRKG